VLAFEVPVVVIVLARMGIVSIDKLKEFRGYFVVLAFIIAAVVTPPDVVSQLALAVPMCLLYEWASGPRSSSSSTPRRPKPTPGS
jgi:sec-independent protein translocase protein TatC